jgi:hypothetical protein
MVMRNLLGVFGQTEWANPIDGIDGHDVAADRATPGLVQPLPHPVGSGKRCQGEDGEDAEDKWVQ